MRKVSVFIALMVAFHSSCLAEERGVLNAGKRQDLLAPAAAMALEEENIKLLGTLKDSGWNPALVLGAMPDKDIEIECNPLTYACLLNKVKSLDWLVRQCGLSLDSRDGNLHRPIDILLENEVNSKDALLLIGRKGAPKESDALEELACVVIRKFGSACDLELVNGSKPDGVWNGFDASMAKIAAIVADDTKGQAPSKPVPISIEWKKINEHHYEFSIGRSSNSWGAGARGEMDLKYGFWVLKNVKFFDS